MRRRLVVVARNQLLPLVDLLGQPCFQLGIGGAVGLGVTAFIFDVTRDKLMQMAWFRSVYGWFVWARAWAHAQTEPIRQRVRQLVWLLRPQRAGTFLRRLIRLRRRAWRRRAA